MRKIFKYDAVNSTNDLLMKWAENKSISSGSIIWALKQYKGKGQHGRIWESEVDDSLTFSVLIRHDGLKVMDQFIFNKAISVALLTSLQVFSPHFKIKWPNDIYINGKKIAGILIENSIKGKYLDYSIIGIGVNVNQRKFPNHLTNASSILNETGEYVDLQILLNQINDHIDFFINYIKENRHSDILDIYLNSLYMKDKVAVFEKEGTNFNGMIRGVDEFGRVNIELEDGDIVSFGNGEIRFKI